MTFYTRYAHNNVTNQRRQKVDDQGKGYLIDLGEAKVAYADGADKGTFYYMAPEIINSDQEELYTPAVDVWSFGVVLWEVWPRPDIEDPISTLYCAGRNLVRFAREVTSGVLRPFTDNICCPLHERWMALVDRCTQYNADRRPSMAEVLTELELTTSCWGSICNCHT